MQSAQGQLGGTQLGGLRWRCARWSFVPRAEMVMPFCSVTLGGASAAWAGVGAKMKREAAVAWRLY